MKSSGIITFLSDFGVEDWFVGVVKGEILKINKDARIIDITHSIRAHNIRSAAFILYCAYRNFPKGTVHLVVVDPGVGSERRAVAMESDDHFFVAPDNGVLSYVMIKSAVVYKIPTPVTASSTFHARDVFAPAAARLSSNAVISYERIPIKECEWFAFPACTMERKVIKGEIIHIDHFGNCITNVPMEYNALYFELNGICINVRDYYSDALEQELIAIKGSHGYYEITLNQGNAQYLLRVEIGARITAYVQ
jgi:S-adenosylmethionine hydrolase